MAAKEMYKHAKHVDAGYLLYCSVCFVYPRILFYSDGRI